jgi:hypothetical protein
MENNELLGRALMDSFTDNMEDADVLIKLGEDFKLSIFEAEGKIKTSYRDIEIEVKRSIIDLNFILAKFEGEKARIRVEVL